MSNPEDSVRLRQVSRQPGSDVLLVRYSLFSPYQQAWMPYEFTLSRPVDLFAPAWDQVTTVLKAYYPSAIDYLILRDYLKALVVPELDSHELKPLTIAVTT